MDLRNPWIVLHKPWIRTLRGQSMDCAPIAYAYISIAHVECDAQSVHVHGLYKPTS